MYDAFKHITTLSTASILILATILEKFVKAGQWYALVPTSFAAFMMSIVGCIGMMFAIYKLAGDLAFSDDPRGSEIDDFTRSRFVHVAFSLALIGFLSGLACLGIFVSKNI